MRHLTLSGIVVALVLFAAPSRADERADRVRKVKVALALAAAPPVTATADCCREDAAAAWDDALKERKPLVLFVGGECGGLGAEAHRAGAVAVKVPEYAGSKDKRIVVGSPRANGSGFESVVTLPAKAKPGEVRAAVQDATPKRAEPVKLAPAKVDWYIN